MNPGRDTTVDFEVRLDAALQQLADLGDIDALLVPEASNIAWLTGFSGHCPWMILSNSGVVMAVDPRYCDRVRAELAERGLATRVEVHEISGGVVLGAGLQACGISWSALGANPASLSHAQWLTLANPVAPVSGLIEGLRRCKSAAEIALIEQACSIAEGALGAVAPLLGDGMTEVEVAIELEYLMRRAGADDASYRTIVASGPIHAARPHHGAGSRRLVEGDVVVIDVGALVEGYHSDMTRTFVIGEPSNEQLDWYRLVAEAQAAGLATIGAGISVADVDRACRQVFIDAGMADDIRHISGHGVGLDIHEDPFVSERSEAQFMLGDVVTVEPGLYREGFGGVRIEDLVVIEHAGPRLLTTFDKDSPCLPSRRTI